MLNKKEKGKKGSTLGAYIFSKGLVLYPLFLVERIVNFVYCMIERFLFEWRKVIGFALSTPHDWLNFFIQSEVKPKPIVTRSHAFSRALRQLPVITSSFDWFTVLSVSFVIGCSNYLGFGEADTDRKDFFIKDFTEKRHLLSEFHHRHFPLINENEQQNNITV